jgi:hypothetical protein
VPKRPPALAPDLVRDFVQKAHSDLAGTQALLTEQPALLNATWDWGGGDFEAGIGGAGHMGNREIAEFPSPKARGSTSLSRPCWATSTWSARR